MTTSTVNKNQVVKKNKFKKKTPTKFSSLKFL